MNNTVFEGSETEIHSLDGLQRGVTYLISIIALSDHFPSVPVGPVTVVCKSPQVLSLRTMPYLFPLLQ